MDMKRILQAMDGVATKPVVGADSMAKFLRVVSEAEINQPAPVAPAPAAPTAPVAPAATTAPAQPASTLSPEQLAYNQLRAQLDSVDSIRGDTSANTFTDISPEVVAGEARMRTKLAQMAAALQAKGIDAAAEYDAPDPAVPAAAPVDLAKKYVDENTSMSRLLSIIQKNDVKILNEGKGPHKVALPVQMAMQHYQTDQVVERKPRIIDKYFQEAEQAINQHKEDKRGLINQYAKVIAERVLMKESKLRNKEDLQAKRKALQDIQMDPHTHKDPELKAELAHRKAALEKEAKRLKIDEHEAGFERVGMAGVGIQSAVAETPIDMSGDPNDPHIYGHEKANPMSLKGRIQQARTQLRELAELAESDELVVWERITRLSKGGMFMGLEQNLEQIRHGIGELAAKRKRGGVASRGIDKNIGEDNDPCWDSHKMVGTKKKGGKTVPNCVPKE
jgi:hypothetical protein